MDKVIYYGALLFCAAQVIVVLFLIKEAYGRDMFFAALLLVPPLVCIKALLNGPDSEERRLARKLRKAKLQHELETLAKP